MKIRNPVLLFEHTNNCRPSISHRGKGPHAHQRHLLHECNGKIPQTMCYMHSKLLHSNRLLLISEHQAGGLPHLHLFALLEENPKAKRESPLLLKCAETTISNALAATQCHALFFGRRPLAFRGSPLEAYPWTSGNRTTTGSLSASPRTTPYQLSRRDTSATQYQANHLIVYYHVQQQRI